MPLEKQSGFFKLGLMDIEIGKPLRYPLYDGNREVLLKRGAVIETIYQCEMLVAKGLYRSLGESGGDSEASVAKGVPASRASNLAASAAAPVAKGVPPSRESISTLDATKVRVGDPLQMQSSAEAPRLVVKLIGYLKNRGLIVSLPESDGEFVMLKEGQSFIVRFFSGQSAYAFTTTVSKQTSVPFPHVHLAYPREVRGLEIRKNSRIDVELIAAVTAEGETKVSAGKITNLSTGGAAMRAKGRLGRKGDMVNIKFKLLINDIQTYTIFDALICAISEDQGDPGMPFLHGIQFVDPEQNMTLAVAAYVYQKLLGDSH